MLREAGWILAIAKAWEATVSYYVKNILKLASLRLMGQSVVVFKSSVTRSEHVDASYDHCST
jgi:hypothetical protein